MKIHYIGKTYKIQEIILSGQKGGIYSLYRFGGSKEIVAKHGERE